MMKWVALCLVGLIFGSTEADKDSISDAGPVVYVNILYRHGERTILSPFKGDPNGAEKYWPLGYGQLTNEGVLHHYSLGTWLRDRYSDLIPNDEYRSKLIHIQSTDMDRTLMSAEANLNGFFRPTDDEMWTQNAQWTPIPVHTIPRKQDKVLAALAPCKNYDIAFKKFKESKEFKKMDKRYKGLYKYASKHFKDKITSMGDIYVVHTNTLIEESFNMKIPKWLKKIYPRKTAEPTGRGMAIDVWTTQLKRLKSGPLVKEMLQNIDDKINGKTEKAISVYSAHDDTIAHLTKTLEVYNMLLPPFACVVALELRNTTSGYTVNIMFKNSTDPFAEPYYLKPPKCKTFCPLDEFKDIYKDIIPDDWDKECGNDE